MLAQHTRQPRHEAGIHGARLADEPHRRPRRLQVADDGRALGAKVHDGDRVPRRDERARQQEQLTLRAADLELVGHEQHRRRRHQRCPRCTASGNFSTSVRLARRLGAVAAAALLRLELHVALEQPAQRPVGPHDRALERRAAVDAAERHADAS